MITDPEPISAAIVDAAVKVHRALGPALLESIYQRVLQFELEERRFKVERERRVRIIYGDRAFDHRLRVDLLVNGIVVVEVKSVDRLAPIHFKQAQSYLRLLNLPLALILNFGTTMMKGQIRRIVNNHTPSPLSKLRINQTRAQAPAPETERKG